MSEGRSPRHEGAVEGRFGSVGIERGDVVRAVAIAAIFALVFFLIPHIVGIYWVKILTAAAIYSVVALGLGLLYGRVGMVSLCQIALLALGAWVATRLLYGTGLPFPIVLLMAGLATGVIGVLVGLPALRVSGLHLALITLMFAGAITLVLGLIHFPNGGKGFLGQLSLGEFQGFGNIRRPGIAEGDTAFYRYTLVVVALMFLLALWQVASKPGRAWAAIRESEHAALAAGVNITQYKLWAFGLASFMTGVAGGLLAGSAGALSPQAFPTQDSIVLLAVILMGGIYSLWGAVVAGLLVRLLPALLEDWGVSNYVALLLFGIGVLQVLATAPGGLVDQVPKDLKKLFGLLSRGTRRQEPPEQAA
ncbi:MAG: branched-chain amino acid ABC transporter permease [Gaiellaceae bacterium]